MTRDDLILYLRNVTSDMPQGYYLVGPVDLDEELTLAVWCHRCGCEIAERLDREHGLPNDYDEEFMLDQAWSGDDILEVCGGYNNEYGGCGRYLQTGGITKHGIRELLYDNFPERPELLAAAESMVDDDEDWYLWTLHVLECIQDDGEETRWMNMDAKMEQNYDPL